MVGASPQDAEAGGPLGIMQLHATAMINCIKTQTISHRLPRQVVEPEKVKLHVALYIQSVVVINYSATVSEAESSGGRPRRGVACRAPPTAEGSHFIIHRSAWSGALSAPRTSLVLIFAVGAWGFTLFSCDFVVLNT